MYCIMISNATISAYVLYNDFTNSTTPLIEVDQDSKQDQTGDDSSSSLSSDNEQDKDGEILKRHYKGLQKEMGKKKPNAVVVNHYLNKEFQARREWLTHLSAEERVNKLLNSYPCFKDHIEVVEEARRVLQIPAGERGEFMGECVKRLMEEIDPLIYFGIHMKGVNPPRSPSLNAKILHVFKLLPLAFTKQKAPKKPIELLHELKNHEDPDTWCDKRAGNVPVLLLDQESCYMVVGKTILFTTEVKKLVEAVVAYLATFYLLDFDYPRYNEIGLNILQYYAFKDHNVPNDMSISFKALLLSYQNYKNDTS